MECDRRYDHLVNFADYLKGKTLSLSCSLETTRKFVLTANLAFESAGTIQNIGAEFAEKLDGNGHPVAALRAPDDFLCVKDIEMILQRAVADRKLFSELGVPWAQRREPFGAAGYQKFERYK